MYITYIVYTTGSAKCRLYFNQLAVPYVGTFIRLQLNGSAISNQVRSIRFNPDANGVTVEVFILLSSSDEMKRFNEDKTWEDYPVADLPL